MKKSVSVLLTKAVQEVLLDYTSSIVKILLIVALFIYLGINLQQSQRVHTLYFDLIEEKKPAAVVFLQRIQTLSSFDYFLKGQSSFYGQTLLGDVEKEKTERREQIQTFLALLRTYPSSREVLYGLSVLYRENGEMDKAAKYLKKAKAIDPVVQ